MKLIAVIYLLFLCSCGVTSDLSKLNSDLTEINKDLVSILITLEYNKCVTKYTPDEWRQLGCAYYGKESRCMLTDAEHTQFTELLTDTCQQSAEKKVKEPTGTTERRQL
jgi:hypothetical protein